MGSKHRVGEIIPGCANRKAIGAAEGVVEPFHRLILILYNRGLIIDQPCSRGMRQIVLNGECGVVEPRLRNLISRERLTCLRVDDVNPLSQWITGITCIQVGGKVTIKLGRGRQKGAARSADVPD